ncbi:MAG TPA: hypothetical protein VH105_06055 [Burkholderiales bacterium]|nr:hypothetical protein [Burkholderiales bacterium]
MKPNSALALAIALALFAWFLFAAGATRIFIDTVDPTAQVGMDAEIRLQAIYCQIAGAICLLGAVWLSGYSWSAARAHAIVSLAVCLLPVAWLISKEFS